MGVGSDQAWTLTPPGETDPVFQVSPLGGVSARSFTALSDATLKHNIRSLRRAPDLIDRLRPVSFQWKADGATTWGFVAQEVRSAAPQLVDATQGGHLRLRVLDLLPVLVQELQDLRRRCAAVESRQRHGWPRREHQDPPLHGCFFPRSVARRTLDLKLP